MYAVYRFLNKHLKMLVGLWSSFSAATILGGLNNHWDDFIVFITDFSNIAVVAFYLISGVLLFLLILFFISKRYTLKQIPTKKFIDIMNKKTFEILRSSQEGQIEFSWGYNKNIHRCKDPAGWDPSAFWISHYDDSKIYSFPQKKEATLVGYDSTSFDLFCDSERIKKCRKNNNDMDRYAVYKIHPNFNNREKRVQIELQRTKWSALQFHWDYMRVLGEDNKPIERNEKIYNEYKKVFLNHSQDNFLINSFCLHLILEDSNGNAILSRISSNKKNDYSGTWAATIGEQLSLEDFYNERDNSTYPDFITRWTKRALEEEFDISEFDKTLLGGNELEDYVKMSSLRVLSIDMEGDIYNVAVTAVIQLKISVDDLRSIKGIGIDSEELTELKACNFENIRKILLEYPGNSGDYHPSTYLRLLMFYLQKKGIEQTCSDFVKDRHNKKGIF